MHCIIYGSVIFYRSHLVYQLKRDTQVAPNLFFIIMNNATMNCAQLMGQTHLFISLQQIAQIPQCLNLREKPDPQGAEHCSVSVSSELKQSLLERRGRKDSWEEET